MTGLKRYLEGLNLTRIDIDNWLWCISDKAVCQGGYSWRQHKYIQALKELKNNKGEVNLLSIVGLVYLVFMLIVLLAIF